MQFTQLILLCHWRFILGLIYTKKCSKFWWLKDYSRRFQSKLKKVYFSVNYVSLLKWAFDVNEELAVQFTHSLMEKEDVLVRKSRRRWIYHQVKNGRVCHLTWIDWSMQETFGDCTSSLTTGIFLKILRPCRKRLILL